MTETLVATKKKYLVWISGIHGEYVLADDIMFNNITVQFMLRGHLVRSFLLRDFLRYNDRDIMPVGDE